jgi:hypothetical protein
MAFLWRAETIKHRTSPVLQSGNSYGRGQTLHFAVPSWEEFRKHKIELDVALPAAIEGRLQTSPPPPLVGSSSGKQKNEMKKPGITIHLTDELTVSRGCSIHIPRFSDRYILKG